MLLLFVFICGVGLLKAGVMLFSAIDQFVFEKQDVRVKVSLYEAMPISHQEKHNP